MAFAGFTPIERSRMYHAMTGVEGRDELLQRELFRRPLKPFEQDDRTAAVRDLGTLQLADMVAKRGEAFIATAAGDAAALGYPLRHKRKLTAAASNRKLPQVSRR